MDIMFPVHFLHSPPQLIKQSLLRMGVFAQLYDQRWGLALLAVGFYVVSKIHAYTKLRAFKGPVGTGFFNLWNSWALFSQESHLRYKEACEKYGERFKKKKKKNASSQ